MATKRLRKAARALTSSLPAAIIRVRMAASYRSIFRSPMIRPSSTARDRISAPNIVLQFSPPIPSRSALPAYIAQLNQAHAFDAPVVTKIEPDRAFYPAEDYHQDFLARNLRYPYIVINDLPKIANLKRLFPELYRTTSCAGGGNDPELIWQLANRPRRLFRASSQAAGCRQRSGAPAREASCRRLR